MSDEDQLREELRRQEELAEKRALTPKPNPLAEEGLRPKPSYEELQEELKTLKRQMANMEESMLTRHNGHPEAPLTTGHQRGLGWRKGIQIKAREWATKGAEFNWILWKIRRETGATRETAKQIIEDAREEEPEPEPKGAPKKK